MESKRQQKVGRQIQKDLGEIFQKDAQHLTSGAFVTITAVRVTPDLSIARAYLSFLPDKNKTMLLETIRENTRFVRQKLAERVRHQLSIVPHLQFYIDDTAEYAAKMDQLFADLVIRLHSPTRRRRPTDSSSSYHGYFLPDCRSLLFFA
jgi:ribosome-binding factor A